MIQLLIPVAQADGVYDFACKLREAIGHAGVGLVHLSKDNAAEWIAGPDDSVILQMSGYGFDKRGAPLWLLKEIERRRDRIKTLGVFFHELYAFGPPWSSSFWLSPVQRRIVHRMAGLADFWIANREGSTRWLDRFAGDKPHATIPVFSNIGELATLPRTRMPKVVVFGSARLRQATYQAAGDRLFAWARRASLQIHDVGAPVADQQLAATLRAHGVVLHGRLGEAAASSVISNAMYGLLAYPADYVAKSGVFAAYCAHGVCPVLLSRKHAAADGLVGGTHYLPDVPPPESVFDAPAIGLRAWHWYRPHRLDQHAASIEKFLNIMPLK